jgi:hypothetical protein
MIRPQEMERTIAKATSKTTRELQCERHPEIKAADLKARRHYADYCHALATYGASSTENLWVAME